MRQASQHTRLPQIESLENRTLFSGQPFTGQLIGSFAGHLPGTLPVAGSSQITLHLTNPAKTAVVEPATIQIFASPTAAPDPSEMLLATVQQTLRIKPRSAASTRVIVPTPTTLPTGKYFLLAEVNGAVITAAPVQIQSPFSALSVSFAGLPGKPIEIDGWSAGARAAAIEVTNTGNVPLNGNVGLTLSLSADGLADGTQSLLATAANVKVSLKPGKSKVVQLRIAVPPGTSAGGYFLISQLNGLGSLTTVVPAGNSTAVSSRRVAVVNQLPVPHRSGNNVDVVVDSGGVTGGCDTSAGCVDDGGGDVFVDYGGGDDSGNYTAISDSDGSDDSDNSGGDDPDSSDDGVG